MNLGKIAAVLAGALAHIAPAPAPPSATAAQAPSRQANGVTLITGDRVVVTGRGHRVHPGPGRQDVGFTSQVRGEHLYVIPSDAHPLISRGVLDQRLFDVTQLLKWRYGDEAGPPGRSAGLPNPRAEGLVSLRATVTGAEGAGLTQTVIRAYAVG